jgi:hypothetical protein
MAIQQGKILMGFWGCHVPRQTHIFYIFLPTIFPVRDFYPTTSTRSIVSNAWDNSWDRQPQPAPSAGSKKKTLYRWVPLWQVRGVTQGVYPQDLHPNKASSWRSIGWIFAGSCAGKRRKEIVNWLRAHEKRTVDMFNMFKSKWCRITIFGNLKIGEAMVPILAGSESVHITVPNKKWLNIKKKNANQTLAIWIHHLVIP